MKTKEQIDAIRTRLAELEMENGGVLTPDAVEEDARDPDNPMHDQFEWDDSKAGHSFRLIQARTLITSVRVVCTTTTTYVKVPYYVENPAKAPGEQGYVSTATLRTDADMAREALVNEFSRIAHLLRRARNLAVALDATDDIETLIASVVGLRQRFADSETRQ